MFAKGHHRYSGIGAAFVDSLADAIVSPNVEKGKGLESIALDRQRDSKSAKDGNPAVPLEIPWPAGRGSSQQRDSGV
jgi:hypothetical protein